jgi:hypothetical protein
MEVLLKFPTFFISFQFWIFFMVLYVVKGFSVFVEFQLSNKFD